MASKARLGQGSLLAVEDAIGSAIFVNIAEALTIGGPSQERAEVDVTNMDSPGAFLEFIAGLADPGEVTFGINYNPQQNPSHDDSGTGVVALFGNREVREWRLRLNMSPDNTVDVKFTAFVRSIPLTVEPATQTRMDITLRVTGVVTFTKN